MLSNFPQGLRTNTQWSQSEHWEIRARTTNSLVCFGILVPPKVWFSGKDSTCQCRRHMFDPWVRKIPLRKEWLSTPVFLPRESQGQRSLADYSPWGCKEPDMIEQLSMHTSPNVCT